jgi:hypothetical protein
LFPECSFQVQPKNGPGLFGGHHFVAEHHWQQLPPRV